METRAFRIKLKPGSRDRVREWAEQITRRQEEALETLRDEGVLLESFFLDQQDDQDYLIGIMTAASFERSQAVVQDSTHTSMPIIGPSNEKHGNRSRCLNGSWSCSASTRLLRAAKPRAKARFIVVVSRTRGA